MITSAAYEIPLKGAGLLVLVAWSQTMVTTPVTTTELHPIIIMIIEWTLHG